VAHTLKRKEQSHTSPCLGGPKGPLRE
jgi:hypothetical protein